MPAANNSSAKNGLPSDRRLMASTCSGIRTEPSDRRDQLRDFVDVEPAELDPLDAGQAPISASQGRSG